MPYHQNSAGHGGRRCETARKTEIKIHGHHQEGHQKECADGRQHSRPQELEIGSVQGDSLTWKSLQGENLNEVIHTATDGRNGLFAPLLSRLLIAAIRGNSAAIRGDLLISDTHHMTINTVNCNSVNVELPFFYRLGLGSGLVGGKVGRDVIRCAESRMLHWHCLSK